jgi:mRNA interferase HigB
MRVIKRSTLQDFWLHHRETEQPLRAWLEEIRAAQWRNMAELKSTYPKASVINSERVVFNICGGNYRLIVSIKYSAQIVFVKFIGTHSEYDRINAALVADF